MPKIHPYRPAAAYAPDLPGAQDRLLPVLAAHRRYLLDDRLEALADMARPVVDRPVLRLHLFHASVNSEPDGFLFVTDDLATLSGDAIERVAVIGALLQYGSEVIVGGDQIDGAWYQEKVRRLGFKRVGPVLERLQDFRGDFDVLWGRWTPPRDGIAAPFLPTTILATYPRARLRAKELKEIENLTIEQIADRLALEGYQNADERKAWYPKNVRQALEQGL